MWGESHATGWEQQGQAPRQMNLHWGLAGGWGRQTCSAPVYAQPPIPTPDQNPSLRPFSGEAGISSRPLVCGALPWNHGNHDPGPVLGRKPDGPRRPCSNTLCTLAQSIHRGIALSLGTARGGNGNCLYGIHPLHKPPLQSHKSHCEISEQQSPTAVGLEGT